MFKCISKSTPAFSLSDHIERLHYMYTPIDLDKANHSKKVKALHKLTYILKMTNRKSLQESNFREIVLCSLTLLYYFGMRLKLKKLSPKYKRRCIKKHFLNSEAAFQRTMDSLHPERREETMSITLKFFTDSSLWTYRTFTGQILQIVLYYNRGRLTLFNFLLTDIHRFLLSDVTSARCRMRVLYDLLQSDNWVIDNRKLLPFVTRLLDFFAYSMSRSEFKKTEHKYLRKGFEVCLRRIFERAENHNRLTIIVTMLNWFAMVNMAEDDVLEFSLLLDRAAQLYKVGSYTDSFSEGLFDHVLRNLVGSSDSLKSLVGCRLLQRFLDRQNNCPRLILPTLYYEFTQIPLAIGKYDSGDKIFIRQHREKFHTYFLEAIRKHCHSTVNLSALSTVICCIVLEVPCRLTAAAAACILMSIQEFAINEENLPATNRYWMHAIVISGMSLICWVHKARVLYGYVKQIISRRAKDAPQLNPPLVPAYDIARQDMRNSQILFFEDWELRFGLWKHFQSPKNKELKTETVLLGKKVPRMDLS